MCNPRFKDWSISSKITLCSSIWTMVSLRYPSSRVSQLDADILDTELVSLLKQQLISVFNLHTGGWTYDQHSELWDLILNLAVFKLTVGKKGSSYGSQLQNLKLSDYRTGKPVSKKKKLVLGGVIIGTYLFQKLQTYIYSLEVSGRAADSYNLSTLSKIRSLFISSRNRVISLLNSTLRLLNLINFTAFLIDGRFPTVLHRLLGIILSPVNYDSLKFDGDNVNFEFQNRQLVWNVMTEFLVFIVPLLQLKKLRRMASSLVALHNMDRARPKNSVAATDYSHLPVSQCAICIQAEESNSEGRNANHNMSFYVTNPYVTNCGHIYCYVCIASKFNFLENSDFGNEGCLRCGTRLEWFREFGSAAEEVDEDAVIVKNNVDFSANLDQDSFQDSLHDHSIPGSDESQHEGSTGNESSDFSEEDEYEQDDDYF